MTTNEITRARQSEILAPNALAVVHQTEIDTQIQTARAYPRDLAAFHEKTMQLASSSVEVANSMRYGLERKDKNGQTVIISGPSIRFAEIVAYAYGNIRVAGRIVLVDEKTITAEGICHDLETNVATRVEVTRSIWSTYGNRRYSLDMINVTGQAAISIARRNAILGTVPRSLYWDAYLHSQAAAMPDPGPALAKHVAGMVKAVKALGVSEAELLAFLGKEKRAEVTPDDVRRVHAAVTAIDDGATSVDAVFRGKQDVAPAGPDEKAEANKRDLFPDETPAGGTPAGGGK